MKSKKRNKLLTLLKQANENYPDEQIAHYFNMNTAHEKRTLHSDTLALFIGREIISVFDDTVPLGHNADRVYDALNNAITELERVRDSMDRVK